MTPAPAPAEAPLTVAAALLCVTVLALAPAVALGIARFAYALVLPAMQADLGWTYIRSGGLNTTNAVGYLLGALLAAAAIRTLGSLRVVGIGLAGCIAGLGLAAATTDFGLLNASRALAGIAGALAFVAGGVVAAEIAQRRPDRAALILAVYYAGPGLGIVLSGVLVPMVLGGGDPPRWQRAWLVLAALAVPLSLALAVLRGRFTVSAAAEAADPVEGPAMPWLLAGYAVFGAGYIAYMTFMLAWIGQAGAGAGSRAVFWIVLGAAAMSSPWLWPGVLAKGRHGRAFALLAGVCAVGAILPLVLAHTATLLVSAALFGCSFFAVVAATTAFVRRNLPKRAWPSAIGRLTVAFGLGQTVGPVGTGWLSDWRGSLTDGLWLSAGLLLLAALIGWRQRDG